MASDQVNQDTSLLMNSHHDSTNGIVAHKVEDSNSSRKERRKEWWHKSLKKKRVKLESAEENKVEEKTAGVNTSPDGEIDKKQEPETQRTRLRNRETITKPDSLKYEPDFSKGFHTKLMQNIFDDSSKKRSRKGDKQLSESFTKSTKRKHATSSAAHEPETAKKTKSAEAEEVFDSYKFSLNLINGDVDISKNAGGKGSKNKYVLFIGNLPYDITREQLEEHFRKTGGIKSIRIPREKGTDKGRGFAYMEFDGRISHGIALRLHHTTLRGRKINVEFTSIGGGKSEARKEKLKLKNKKRRKMKMQ